MARRDAEMMRAAWQLRQEMSDNALMNGSEGVFDQNDYREGLKEVLEPWREKSFDGLVNDVASAVDKAATQEDSELEKTPLLPGIYWDIDGEYRLGTGERVRKINSTLKHAETMLALSEENLRNVKKKDKIKHEEVELLRPYWKRGRTKKQAIEAYEKAHEADGETA